MIEELYNDPEYYTQEDPQLKYEIEKITFLVRDADKIANYQLLSQSGKDIWSLFNITKDIKQKTPLSDKVFSRFMNNEIILKQEVKTNSDYILLLICWIFDLNYASSFVYMKEKQCFDFLIEELRNSNSDFSQQKLIEDIISNYVKNRTN